ncbi:MAG TPA: KH domain-containing protein [Leptospiraceae bacterium]|nr:KH domain-containing protein [Leptospiraceae bacterium]HMW04626.1 KH domain-containing protein [Leptospiraceae bacterium]HMX31653.1 KH domain-containing protein [Leptospiraceae bacterium]HMY30462.1 KH domain-containing protein [Leptospiraceae bacterium]HMZ66653.1 KH domain-containing protein [Leptospiraceae bacterium]
MHSEALLRYVVSFLVDKPDAVNVREVQADSETILELMVAPEDIGKVIGRNGRIAKSLRTLIAASGAKEGKNYSLEIID